MAGIYPPRIYLICFCLGKVNGVSEEGVCLKLDIMRGKNETISKNSNSLILIKTNQTEKVKKILEREKVGYEIYNSETNLKAKTSPRSKNVKELINSLDRARIKYLVINNK